MENIRMLEKCKRAIEQNVFINGEPEIIELSFGVDYILEANRSYNYTFLGVVSFTNSPFVHLAISNNITESSKSLLLPSYNIEKIITGLTQMTVELFPIFWKIQRELIF
jgi:hypothetical protein